jgi:hypothetical protein
MKQTETAAANSAGGTGRRGREKRSLVLRLSQQAIDALKGEAQADTDIVAPRLESAIRLYLADRDSARPAWPYPAFLRGSEVREDVELQLSFDSDLWLLFDAEALRQQVSSQQLCEHAAFYFGAELETGRLTQRILEDLDLSEGAGEV